MVNIITNYECNKDCNFCFQKGISSGSMMNLKDFRKVIGWVDQFRFFQIKDQRKVSLMGGEPTLNPDLSEMIQYLKKQDVKAIIFTNFLFRKDKLKLFDPNVVQGFVGTYNPSSSYRKREYERMEENISELKKRGFSVKLSYNITEENLDYTYILDACERHGLDAVRFSTAFPNPDFDNEYMNPEKLWKAGPVINRFVREAVKRNIKPYLDCTIPLCILGSENDILFFFKHVHMGSQICKSTADINPDLSMSYCMPLHQKVHVPRIFEFEQMKDINNHFEEMNKESRNHTYLFEDCIDCKYRIRKLCQGGCLALKRKFHFSVSSPKEQKTYNIETWGGIGDGLMTTPVFKSLKERNPNCHVNVLANKNHAPLLENNPYIDTISISPDRSSVEGAEKVLKTDYGKLKPSLRQGHAIDIIAGMLGVELKDKRPDIFLRAEEEEAAKNMMNQYENPIIMQITSKASKNQNWSKNKWKLLVRSMPDYAFIQVGSLSEEKIEGAVDLRGKTGIRESIAMLKYAKAFVGVVSFMAHATVAVNKPSVILFGPSDPDTWGYEQNINLHKKLECSPCIDTLGNGPCLHDNRCMADITVEEVKDSLLTLTKDL